MQHIFLSYNRANKTAMEHLRDDLHSSGLKTWTSEYLSPGSNTWNVATPKAIKKALCMLLILTPGTQQSDWIQLELYYAQEFGVDVITVLAEGIEDDRLLPVIASSLRYDLSNEDTYNAELERLVAALYEMASATQVG